MRLRMTTALLVLSAALSGCAAVPFVSRDTGFAPGFVPMEPVVLIGVYR